MKLIMSFMISFLFISAVLVSEESKVESFSLNVDGKIISTTVSITPRLPQPVVERIRGGLPTVFNYWFKLKSVSPYWKDKKLARTRVSVTVKYDPVRVEYHLTYRHKGELVDKRVLHHWQEAVAALTNLNRWQIFTVPDDAVEKTLYVEAWVHLLSGTKWLFIPDDISTDVVTSPYFTVYE